ncbi:MAG TPA: DNA mismatch repair endonuclease MutL [Dehalococcoidia bacterium]|nr:DNA mismatch repair endonuclease MutL [Dehalococcoidia bacterium]
MSIRVLPPDVAATIAAGEVIERPASAVKELLENAIDAGAGAIRIELARGGLELIRVSDDGRGVPAAEVETAFQRHATSKLRSAGDLATLTTLGFRGEALPSLIAAAAEVQFSSHAEGEGVGCRALFRDGRLVERKAAGQAQGTTVALRGLFANQPARLKFLRSPAAEAVQVAGVVHPYALAYPRLRLLLTIDGRQVLHTTGSGEARDAAARVLGAELAAQMLAIVDEEKGARDLAPRVRGLISPPSLSRATRGGIMLFVNRRWVQPRRLAFAIEQAYDTLLTVGRHPIAVVLVELPPGDVDVNVHPTKAEVRFRDERAVFGAVHAAVRRTLIAQAPVPDFTLGPDTAMSQAGAIGFGGPAVLDAAQPAQAPLWQTLLRPDDHTGAREEPDGLREQAPRLPLLRVVGQTGSTYVVAEGPTGVYLIDQHAAHERVLYEQICREREGTAVEVQGLLAPVPVELTPAQAAVFTGYGGLLAAHGFSVEPFGERALLLRALPAILAGADPARALTRLLDALDEEHEAPSHERLLKTLACHGSVRAGKVLSLEEMRALVLELEGCEAPRTCPHGRPTMVHLSAATLEREFKRR